MRNILIVYSNLEYPARASVLDHLYSFKRYSSCNCFYLNLAISNNLSLILNTHFDLIIFHTIFLSKRGRLNYFAKLVDEARPLKQLEAIKVALPQDEYIQTDALCEFINEFEITYIFSVAPASEWPKIYDKIDERKVKIFEVLTAYLDESRLSKINQLPTDIGERFIDVGYRTKPARPWLGKHGLLKSKIADIFQEEAINRGITTDISTRAEDTLLGDDWYKFLLQCKYTIGIEGGASILDRDGTIQQKSQEFILKNPQASFEEIEVACFQELEGSLQLFAISPRHLEACATRTCQVLVEGSYNGVLIPGQHYIELKKDFSNLDRVLNAIQQDSLRNEMTERAYQDIVQSNRYTYQRFVNFILEQSLQTHPRPKISSNLKVFNFMIGYGVRYMDRLSWVRLWLYWLASKIQTRFARSMQDR